MKYFFLTVAFAMVFIFSACKKSDTANTPTNATVVGTWSGTGQYGTASGTPTYVFTLTFNSNGTVAVVGNNSTANDTGTGTWALTGDVLTATYKYLSSSATYTLAGRFSASLATMTGTIGLGTATTGVGLFSVAKQ